MRSSLAAIRHAYGLFKTESRLDTMIALGLLAWVLLTLYRGYRRYGQSNQ